MNAVILKSTHDRIMRGINARAFRFNLAVCILAFVLAFVFSHVTSRENIPDKLQGKVLEMLRDKPITLNQGLAIAETINSQYRALHIPPEIVLGVIETESEFNPGARSRIGAKGLMQLTEITWQDYLEKLGLPKDLKAIHDPAINITVGIMFLKDLYSFYGNWKKALAHYYTGSDKETKISNRYIQAVMKEAKRFSEMLNH